MVKRPLIVLIQARVHSTRLKGKIFFDLFDEKVIDRIIRIAKKIELKKKIYLLSGSKKKNYIIQNFAKKHSIECIFGNETNVLSRFKKVIVNKNYYNNYILRITSDNYLIQPKILNKMIRKCIKGKFDYCYIDSLSHYAGEVFLGNAIFKQNSKNLKNIEHVTFGLRKNNKIKVLKINKKFMNIDHTKFFTLDDISDLITMKYIERKFKKIRNLDCIKTIKEIQKKWKFV